MLVETVLRSNLFFSEAAYRRRIKSPVEFALGMIVGLEGLVPTSRLASDLAALGQNLGEPPTSAGWEGGTAWINPATLVGRANLASALLSEGGSYGAGLDPRKAAEAHGCGAPATAGRWLIDLLIQGDLPAPAERLVLESAPKRAGRRAPPAGTHDRHAARVPARLRRPSDHEPPYTAVARS